MYIKDKKEMDDMTIGPNDGNKWSKKKSEAITAKARLHHSKRDTYRLMRNAMLAVRYRIEDYVALENVK